MVEELELDISATAIKAEGHFFGVWLTGCQAGPVPGGMGDAGAEMRIISMVRAADE